MARFTAALVGFLSCSAAFDADNSQGHFSLRHAQAASHDMSPSSAGPLLLDLLREAATGAPPLSERGVLLRQESVESAESPAPVLAPKLATGYDVVVPVLTATLAHQLLTEGGPAPASGANNAEDDASSTQSAHDDAGAQASSAVLTATLAHQLLTEGSFAPAPGTNKAGAAAPEQATLANTAGSGAKLATQQAEGDASSSQRAHDDAGAPASSAVLTATLAHQLLTEGNFAPAPGANKAGAAAPEQATLANTAGSGTKLATQQAGEGAEDGQAAAKEAARRLDLAERMRATPSLGVVQALMRADAEAGGAAPEGATLTATASRPRGAERATQQAGEGAEDGQAAAKEAARRLDLAERMRATPSLGVVQALMRADAEAAQHASAGMQ